MYAFHLVVVAQHFKVPSAEDLVHRAIALLPRESELVAPDVIAQEGLNDNSGSVSLDPQGSKVRMVTHLDVGLAAYWHVGLDPPDRQHLRRECDLHLRFEASQILVPDQLLALEGNGDDILLHELEAGDGTGVNDVELILLRVLLRGDQVALRLRE